LKINANLIDTCVIFYLTGAARTPPWSFSGDQAVRLIRKLSGGQSAVELALMALIAPALFTLFAIMRGCFSTESRTRGAGRSGLRRAKSDEGGR
jgi:hypothetical protein